MSNANTYCAKFSPFLLSIVRIAIAILFMQHGGQKLFEYPSGGHKAALFSLMGLGGVLELVGGALIFLGFMTRPVAFILSGEMAVAYFFVFLYMAAAGAGPLSVDALRKKG